MAKGYSRREFVKTFVVTAGAVVAASPLLGACSDDKVTPGGTPDAPSHPDAPSPDAPSPDAGPPPNFFPQSLASGDPRTDSVMLWTRVAPTTAGDVQLTLELATDDQFTQMVTVTPSTVTAAAAADGTVRVKVTALTAATRYFYRFRAASLSAVTNTGRFKTAAAASADVPVKFALLSCQDYVGKFYNTLTELLDASNDDMDFVLFIGDYVYETTGNPQFQGGAASRAVAFSDTAGAIPLGTAEAPFFAAKSVSNYRDLYKIYRSDPTLQKLHEKFPFVIIWDDHEFSDDCWQDVGTYTNGAQDETDAVRRVNSEQAFFEYQPVNLDAEVGTGSLSLSRDQLYPNTKLYRDLRFGKHVHVLLTDYRSFRPDHPVKEEGFPGTILMDEAQTQAAITATSSAVTLSSLPQYVNLDDPGFADQKAAAQVTLMAQYLTAGATSARAAMLTTAATTGNVDVAVLNALWTPQQSALTVPTDGLPHGISNAAMGKTSLFTLLGARYLVKKDPYDLYASFRSTQAATPDDPYGTVQSAWLDDRLAANSDATWKFLVDSVSMTSLIVNIPDLGLPIKGKYYLNCDQWDGFPVHRQTVFEKLRARNAIILSGDIHAAYVTDYGAGADGNRIAEFTCPGVSSGPFAQLLRSTAAAIPNLDPTLVNGLIDVVDSLMMGQFEPLIDAHSDVNGVVVLSVSGTQVKTTYSTLTPDKAIIDSTNDTTLKDQFVRLVFTIDKVAGKNGAVVKVTS